MVGYVKCFDSNKTMTFKVIDKNPLKEYSNILERVSSWMSIKIDSETVDGGSDKYIKTEIKTNLDKVNTNFQGNKIAKENAWNKSLSLIMLYSVIKVGKKYHH